MDMQDVPNAAPSIGDEGPSGWANDNMIQVWMAQLRQIDGIMCLKDCHRPKSLFLDSVLSVHDSITQNDWSRINRWSKTARMIKKMSYLDYDRIFIPCHLGLHWTLQVIHLKQKTIASYNSFNSGKWPTQLSADLLFKFLEYFAVLDGRHFHRAEWKVVSPKCQQQVYYQIIFISNLYLINSFFFSYRSMVTIAGFMLC